MKTQKTTKKTNGGKLAMKNDFTRQCKKCGSKNIQLADGIHQVKAPKAKKYFVFIYGAICRECHRLQYSIAGNKTPLDCSHARWCTFGKEYEDQLGRPLKWNEAIAQSISDRLRIIEENEFISRKETLTPKITLQPGESFIEFSGRWFDELERLHTLSTPL